MPKRYPSDLTEAQWAKFKDFFEVPRPKGGKPCVHERRELLNAILYVMKEGISWRALPDCFPTRHLATRHGRVRARLGASIGITDSTFIESAYGGAGTAPSGYKRATGYNVSVVIDKERRVMALCVLPANLQDADGARVLLPAISEHYPKVKKIMGDKAYRGAPIVAFAAEHGIELNGDSPALPKGTIFKPMPMRWRVAKNWCYSSVGFAEDVYWSVLGLTLRRFA